MATRSVPDTGSVANVREDLLDFVSLVLSQAHQTNLVSSSGSTTSRTQGCRNRESMDTCLSYQLLSSIAQREYTSSTSFFRTSIADSSFPLTLLAPARAFLSNVQILTALPLVLCTAFWTVHKLHRLLQHDPRLPDALQPTQLG